MSVKIEKTKDGIKVINDFLIDIIGSIVPGVIFLFSVTLAVFVPCALILYLGFPDPPSHSQMVATKVDLLISNTFQGWFWLVIFFTFLILAYAIGNIFYRKDIKDMDKKSFAGMKKKHFEDTVLDDFEGLISYGKKDRRRRHIITINYPANDTDIRNFIYKYSELLADQICTGSLENIEVENLRNCIQEMVKDDSMDKFKIISSLNRIALRIYNKETPYYVPEETGKQPEKNENEEKLQKKINGSLLYRYAMFSTATETVETTEQNKSGLPAPSVSTETTIFNALGWYFRFSLRSEFACDEKKHCQFPYIHYDKYLIRRKESHLLRYVHWAHEISRSKNALNKLKLRIQMAAKEEYSILVKNEAHIRMASSSLFVAKSVIWIAGMAMVLLLAAFIANSKDWSNPVVPIIGLMLPGLILGLGIYLFNTIPKFLHYQRLREIFFVLQCYDEIFGKNIKSLPEPLLRKYSKEDTEATGIKWHSTSTHRQ